MDFTFRRRLNAATVTVDCVDGTHTLNLEVSGNVTVENHDAEAEAVYLFLGGEAHNCQKVEAGFRAVIDRDLALRGIADLPELRFITGSVNGGRSGKRWRAPEHCHLCRRNQADGAVAGEHPEPSHFLTLEHIAGATDVPVSLLRKFATWVAQRNPDETRLTNARAVTVAGRLTQHDGMPGGGGPYAYNRWRTQAKALVITDRYIDVVDALTPNRTAQSTDALAPLVLLARSNGGLTAHWLTALQSAARPGALRKAIEAHGEARPFLLALCRARNVSPEQVAAYINGGIYSHFYTYARHRVTAAQALAVYQASGGRTNLADLLGQGFTVPDALTEARRLAAA